MKAPAMSPMMDRARIAHRLAVPLNFELMEAKKSTVANNTVVSTYSLARSIASWAETVCSSAESASSSACTAAGMTYSSIANGDGGASGFVEWIQLGQPGIGDNTKTLGESLKDEFGGVQIVIGPLVQPGHEYHQVDGDRLLGRIGGAHRFGLASVASAYLSVCIAVQRAPWNPDQAVSMAVIDITITEINSKL